MEYLGIHPESSRMDDEHNYIVEPCDEGDVLVRTKIGSYELVPSKFAVYKNYTIGRKFGQKIVVEYFTSEEDAQAYADELNKPDYEEVIDEEIID